MPLSRFDMHASSRLVLRMQILLIYIKCRARDSLPPSVQEYAGGSTASGCTNGRVSYLTYVCNASETVSSFSVTNNATYPCIYHFQVGTPRLW